MEDRTIKWIAAIAALGGLYWFFGRKSREVRVGAFTEREKKRLHASEHDWDKPAVGFEVRLSEGPWRWPQRDPRSSWREPRHSWREPRPSWRVELQPRRYFPVVPERHYYPARRPRVQVQEGYAPEMDIQPYAASAPPPASPQYVAPAPQYAAPAPPPAPPQYVAPAPQYAAPAPQYAAPAPPPASYEAAMVAPHEPSADVPHGITPLPPPQPHAPPHAPPPHAPAPPAPPQGPLAPQGAVPTSPWWQSPPLLADKQHMSPEIRGAFEAMSPESQQSLAWQSLTTGRSMEEILRSGG
jgi:hypothetical protein